MNHGLDTGFLVAIEIKEHPQHEAAHRIIVDLITAGDRLALAPQVLTEFIHVVTDSRRFSIPLTIDQARDVAER